MHHEGSGNYTEVLYDCFLRHRNISYSGMIASLQNIWGMLIMACILQPAPDFFLTDCMNTVIMGEGVFLYCKIVVPYSSFH